MIGEGKIANYENDLEVKEKGFIYEFDDERFKKLSPEEQGVQVQKNWNKYMKDK